MINLISTHEQKKLTLLTFLEKLNKQEIQQWKIEEVLGLSTFKATNLVAELANELQTYSAGLIEISDSKHITPFNIDTELVNQFKLFYLKMSPEFKLFYFFFKNENNLPEFINELNISQAAAYRLIATINDKLAPSGLAIKKQKIIGDEAKIRLKTFELLTFYFKGMDDPFDDDLAQKHKLLIEKMSIFVPLSKSNSLRLKLYSILSISHYRMKQNSLVKTNPFVNYLPGKNKGIIQLYNLIQTHYQDTFPKISSLEIKAEVEYIFTFLISETLIPLDEIENTFKIDAKILALTTDIEERLTNAGIIIDGEENKKT